MRFDNFYYSAIFMFQIVTFDSWGWNFILMMRSKFPELIVMSLFGLCILLALIIHGFVIASFLDTLFKIKKNDNSMRSDYKSIQEISQGLLGFIRYVPYFH